MKCRTIGAFFFGMAAGIGVTLLSLYTQRPNALSNLIGAVADVGQSRRVKRIENGLRKNRLKAMGFTDEEIGEFL